ncbi:MAG: diphthine--ammonia ligase [Thermofilum sp.]
MRVAVLFSGGKDSTLAMVRAKEEHEVACLVTLLPSSVESALFHFPNAHLTELQARALNLPLVKARTGDDEPSGIEALRKALAAARRAYRVEALVTGAVKSRYQLERFSAVCESQGLRSVNPLWGEDEESLLREIVERRIEAIITRVAGYPLTRSLLGRQIDRETVDLLVRLKNYVNPSGEGGEYETFVLDAPPFTKRIVPLSWRVEGGDYDATLYIEKAALASKTSSPARQPADGLP